MKKTVFVVSILLTSISISAQKKYSNILNSTNINEIESFLKEANPNDSRIVILKQKIVILKGDKSIHNSRSTNTAIKAVPVNPTSYYTKTVKLSGNKPSGSVNKTGSEEQEFRKLISETSATHKEKTVKLLNQLFDNDISNEQAILLIKNTGDCNMIVRIQGKEFYKLAVPAHGENFLAVKKGEYQLSGNMCEATYNSTKSIGKNMLVTLNKTSNTSYGEKMGANTDGVSN